MKVFVYGTLKNGHGNNYFLKGAEFLGEANTTKDFTLYIPVNENGYVTSFPYAVEEKSDIGIKGELYKINPDILRSLDHLESYPGFYDRKIIEVKTDDGSSDAWIYHIDKDNLFGGYYATALEY